MTQASREMELEEQAFGGAPVAVMQPPVMPSSVPSTYPEKQ